MKFAIDKKKVNETTTKPSVTLAAVSEKSHNGPTEHSPSTSLSHCNGHRGAEGEIETCEENADNFPCRPDEVCLRIKNNPVVGDFLCAKWKANADQSNFTCDYFSSLNSSLFSASLIGEAKEDK